MPTWRRYTEPIVTAAANNSRHERTLRFRLHTATSAIATISRRSAEELLKTTAGMITNTPHKNTSAASIGLAIIIRPRPSMNPINTAMAT